MSIKESTSSIVRVRVGFGKFVVHAMVTGPVVDATLIGDGITKHKNESKEEMSFVGSVRP